jgi:homotetrameric cytidine deaminase
MSVHFRSLTPNQVEQLLLAAQEASEQAYAPFSNFHVGAAILTVGGRVFKGCNVENSSFGMTNCAERTNLYRRRRRCSQRRTRPSRSRGGE